MAAPLIGSRTVFQACSINKQVAAFGTLRLVAAFGTLRLVAAFGTLRLVAAFGTLRLVVLRQMPNGHYRVPGLDVEIRFQRTDAQTHTMHLRQENRTQTATRHL